MKANTRVRFGWLWQLLTMALFALLIQTLMGMGCGGFVEGVNDLNSFCKTVGEKCSEQTAADCVQKLGGDNAVLKSSPDYKGAKACVDELTSCTNLPDKCWFFAVDKFTEGTQEAPPTDGGAKE